MMIYTLSSIPYITFITVSFTSNASISFKRHYVMEETRDTRNSVTALGVADPCVVYL